MVGAVDGVAVTVSGVADCAPAAVVTVSVTTNARPWSVGSVGAKDPASAPVAKGAPAPAAMDHAQVAPSAWLAVAVKVAGSPSIGTAGDTVIGPTVGGTGGGAA